MTLIQQFLKSFRETDEMEPGLIQKADGTVWLVAPDGSESQLEANAPTDEVVTITHGGAEPAMWPILAANDVAQTITVGGDQTYAVGLCAAFVNTAGMTIAGSTANDGIDYVPASSVYDSGTDRTTITLNTIVGQSLVDSTADGTLQMPIIYHAEIVLAPNAAIEWVLIDTTIEWSSAFYGVIGDDDDSEGFCSRVGAGEPGGVDVSAVGRWQWPVSTLNAASSDPIVLIGGYSGIKFYPDGGTIRIIWTEVLGGSQGSSTIVVHHHFTEPVIPTRIPAA